MGARPSRSYTCLEDRSVFVGSGLHGLWIKTHVCVVMVGCPHCKSPKGECCRGADGHPKSATHVMRRKAAAKLIAKAPKREAVIWWPKNRRAR